MKPIAVVAYPEGLQEKKRCEKSPKSVKYEKYAGCCPNLYFNSLILEMVYWGVRTMEKRCINSAGKHRIYPTELN